MARSRAKRALPSVIVPPVRLALTGWGEMYGQQAILLHADGGRSAAVDKLHGLAEAVQGLVGKPFTSATIVVLLR